MPAANPVRGLAASRLAVFVRAAMAAGTLIEYMLLFTNIEQLQLVKPLKPNRNEMAFGQGSKPVPATICEEQWL